MTSSAFVMRRMCPKWYRTIVPGFCRVENIMMKKLDVNQSLFRHIVNHWTLHFIDVIYKLFIQFTPYIIICVTYETVFYKLYTLHDIKNGNS